MNPLDLLHALLAHDWLTGRQWVVDATRQGFDWSRVERPIAMDPVRLAVYAGLIELLAARSGKEAPVWTAGVPSLETPFWLDPDVKKMPRLRKQCEEEGPEPLRKRLILASPSFLTFA